MGCFHPRDASPSKQKAPKKKASETRIKEQPKDPRTLAPCHLNKETFLLKFPFVQVFSDMTYWKDEDKCGANFMMDYHTLQAIMDHLNPAIQELFVSFSSDGGEMKTRPVHCGLLHEVRKLVDAYILLKNRRKEMTKSVKEGEKSVKEMTKSVKEGETSVKGITKVKGENETEGMKVEVCEIEAGNEDAEARSGSGSREGVDISHETSAGSGIADILVQGYDKAYIAEHRLHQRDVSALCTFMVLEPKGNDIEKIWRCGPGGAYQAGAYSIFEALRNLQKGRKSPIHLQSWSKNIWTYGLLAIDGVVQVSEDGQVVGRPDLQAEFQKREAMLKDYLSDQTATYEAKNHLVAKLYISDEVLAFPNRDLASMDSYRFFEALLRICLGDRVLQWRAQDVEQLFDVVKEIQQSRMEESSRAAVGIQRYESFRSMKRARLY